MLMEMKTNITINTTINITHPHLPIGGTMVIKGRDKGMVMEIKEDLGNYQDLEIRNLEIVVVDNNLDFGNFGIL